MIELVPMAYRIVNDVDAAQSDSDYRLPQPGDKKEGGGSVGGKSAFGAKGSVVASGSASANGKKMDEEEERDAVFYKLESLGYRVGQGLVERYALC